MPRRVDALPDAGPQGTVFSLGRLTRRSEFLTLAGSGRKSVMPGLILQARRHDARQRPRSKEPSIRVGFTASRKVGGAVVRNRAKRRLRALARDVLAHRAATEHDYVLIARAATPRLPYARLRRDLERALTAVDACRHGPESEGTR
ncbi:MAG: ribonuclease P protein component [Inquilinaceae bacterium]